MKTITDLFQALGNDVRFKIVDLLLRERKKNKAFEGMCVCHILEKCKVANSTMSHHLDWLVSVDLLTQEKKGRWIYYDVNMKKFEELKKSVNRLIGG